MDERTTTDPGAELTLAEWEELDEEDRRELVDGTLAEPDVTSFRHDMVASLLQVMIVPWANARGGFVAAAGVRYVVGAKTGRIPDITVFLAGRRPSAEGLVRVPPDIAIEIVSPSLRHARRDRVEKVREYAAFGVRWYWIVDPALRTLEIYELAADRRYVHALAASSGTVGAIPGCAGLALDLDRLWAEVDRLDD